MRKVKISVGKVVIVIDPADTPTAHAILAALPFETRATTWPGEVYFQAPLHADREEAARDVVELGEMAFRTEGQVIIIGYGPTPCSEADEIRLASHANIWGRTSDDVTALASIEAGDLVHFEAVE